MAVNGGRRNRATLNRDGVIDHQSGATDLLAMRFATVACVCNSLNTESKRISPGKRADSAILLHHDSITRALMMGATGMPNVGSSTRREELLASGIVRP